MALKLGGMKQLFKHSKDVYTGLGKARLGEIVVSLDNEGDFDNLNEAINAYPLGASIFMRNGTYILNKDLNIPSNTSIRGESFATIIDTNQKFITMNNKNNILIQNLCLNIESIDNDPCIILQSTNKLTFDKVLFKPKSNLNADILQMSGDHPITNSKIINCTCDTTAGTADGLSRNGMTKTLIEGNRFDTIVLSSRSGDAYFLNNSIRGNFFYSLSPDAFYDSYNIITSNQTDVAIVNAGVGNIVSNNVVF